MESSSETTAARVLGAPIPAAQYLRKSTQLQRYSTENQSEANHDYAALYGLRIVRTYADEGRSGLTAHWRTGLKQLIADIEAGRADFKAVLVYDVSRWGRFQDADESSYYEHLCRRAGINVHYCAEPFKNDGSIYAAIVKSIKRAMAAEYGRELSVKVYAGAANLARRGFRVGGGAPYGMRRLLVDRSCMPKRNLRPGEHKSLQHDRVTLIPGPPRRSQSFAGYFRPSWESTTGKHHRKRAKRWRHRQRLAAALDVCANTLASAERDLHRRDCLEPHHHKARHEKTA
jgi:DNA invertase Pin-like site-specific DNA recombinase